MARSDVAFDKYLGKGLGICSSLRGRRHGTMPKQNYFKVDTKTIGDYKLRLFTTLLLIPVFSPEYVALPNPPLYTGFMLATFFCACSYLWRFFTRGLRTDFGLFGVKPLLAMIILLTARGLFGSNTSAAIAALQIQSSVQFDS